MDERKRTVLLGLAFLLFLLLSYVVNMFFFQSLDVILPSWPLALVMLFVHNVLVVSLILLGLTFYVNLVVLGFFKREKHSDIILEHPRTFALVFTVIVVFLSILRGSSLLGGVDVAALLWILLISAPVGIVEGYGVYLTIKKTLSRTMSTRDLAFIYCIFFIAAVLEVAFIDLLVFIVNMVGQSAF
jgi:hypothetical protein